MNIGLGECTPVPTVVTGADGQPRVTYGSCPTEVVDVLPDGTNVFHDEITGKTTYYQPSSGIGFGTVAMVLGGLVLLMAVKRK